MTLKLRQLFLIDGLGALLSVFMLGFVLVRLESYFGIPISVLYVLAAIPIFFALYDFLCYFFLQKGFPPYIKAIALANISYCIFSLVLAFFHRDSITLFGWLYIVGEILIVVFLSLWEWRLASASSE
ncbi:MAG: hypothetical protein AAFU64_01980 [Bacteroidota bacterium]